MPRHVVAIAVVGNPGSYDKPPASTITLVVNSSTQSRLPSIWRLMFHFGSLLVIMATRWACSFRIPDQSVGHERSPVLHFPWRAAAARPPVSPLWAGIAAIYRRRIQTPCG